LLFTCGSDGTVEFVTPWFPKRVFAAREVVEILDGMLAMDAGGWRLGVVPVDGLRSRDDIMTEFNKLYVASAHATKCLAVSIEIDKVHGSLSPLVAFADVFTERGGCDGFSDCSLVLCIDCASVYMKLGTVGGNGRDDGAVAFEEALVVDSFAVSVAIELGCKREAVIRNFIVLMAEYMG
jgi:hypothetical protein